MNDSVSTGATAVDGPLVCSTTLEGDDALETNATCPKLRLLPKLRGANDAAFPADHNSSAQEAAATAVRGTNSNLVMTDLLIDWLTRFSVVRVQSRIPHLFSTEKEMALSGWC